MVLEFCIAAIASDDLRGIDRGIDTNPGAPDPFGAMASRDAIARGFARLNVDQRVVVALRFYLDLEVDEIARRVGTRPGTVKSRLHRALKTLRASWEQDR